MFHYCLFVKNFHYCLIFNYLIVNIFCFTQFAIRIFTVSKLGRAHDITLRAERYWDCSSIQEYKYFETWSCHIKIKLKLTNYKGLIFTSNSVKKKCVQSLSNIFCLDNVLFSPNHPTFYIESKIETPSNISLNRNRRVVLATD